MEKETSETKENSVDNVSEVGKTNFKRFENLTSRSPKNQPLEVCKKDTNNTKINNTEYRTIRSLQNGNNARWHIIVATGLIIIRFVDSFSCVYFRFDSGNGEKNRKDNGNEN